MKIKEENNAVTDESLCGSLTIIKAIKEPNIQLILDGKNVIRKRLKMGPLKTLYKKNVIKAGGIIPNIHEIIE